MLMRVLKASVLEGAVIWQHGGCWRISSTCVQVHKPCRDTNGPRPVSLQGSWKPDFVFFLPLFLVHFIPPQTQLSLHQDLHLPMRMEVCPHDSLTECLNSGTMWAIYLIENSPVIALQKPGETDVLFWTWILIFYLTSYIQKDYFNMQLM